MKTDRILKISMGVLTAALLAVIIPAMEDQKPVVVGDKAPDFKVITDIGKTVTRENFGGKLLILNFWATWCPPCIQEIPSLNRFQQMMKEKGVVVVAISVDTNEKLYKDFLKRFPVTFTTARDAEADISASYGTFRYPETYVIDSQGQVLEKFIADVNWMDPQVIERVQRML